MEKTIGSVVMTVNQTCALVSSLSRFEASDQLVEAAENFVNTLMAEANRHFDKMTYGQIMRHLD